MTCKKYMAIGRHDVVRMDLFRACASDAFLWLATDDPLHAAMDLLKDLHTSASFNDEHKEVYLELHTRVLAFTTAIVQHCWCFEEVDLLLSQKDGARLVQADMPYPRALAALENHMKPVGC